MPPEPSKPSPELALQTQTAFGNLQLAAPFNSLLHQPYPAQVARSLVVTCPPLPPSSRAYRPSLGATGPGHHAQAGPPEPRARDTRAGNARG